MIHFILAHSHGAASALHQQNRDASNEAHPCNFHHNDISLSLFFKIPDFHPFGENFKNRNADSVQSKEAK